MKKKSKVINNENKKEIGVLYIRYNRNTLCGKVIDRLKHTSGRKLNNIVLNLIFLSELVEPIDWHNIDPDLETLSSAYYRSLKLFSDKLTQAQYKIKNLTPYIIRQKYYNTNINCNSILNTEVDHIPSEIKI
ncbi:hypothetical protein NIES4102_41690 (plasmid) [Chondrocystis sp. NIES-4102]|nr:hypothetical protein NIES4102_41690 [Chondrocystis sp. NIES-4102]